MGTVDTAEPMQTDPVATAAAGTSKQKVDRLTEGRDAPWVEKYRPKTLDDVAAHKEIINTSEQAKIVLHMLIDHQDEMHERPLDVLLAVKKLTNENRLPHLLLYGPPGTGKTSTILAVARQIYGGAMQNMTLELNASDDRGIDVVREQIQDFASTRSVFRSVEPCLGVAVAHWLVNSPSMPYG